MDIDLFEDMPLFCNRPFVLSQLQHVFELWGIPAVEELSSASIAPSDVGGPDHAGVC